MTIRFSRRSRPAIRSFLDSRGRQQRGWRRGAALIADRVLAACPQVQHVVMAAGTGGTFAGLVRGLRDRAMAHGVSVTKDDSIEVKVRDWLRGGIGHDAWRFHGDCHWGGCEMPKI